jgi:hypothetical protein
MTSFVGSMTYSRGIDVAYLPSEGSSAPKDHRTSFHQRSRRIDSRDPFETHPRNCGNRTSISISTTAIETNRTTHFKYHLSPSGLFARFCSNRISLNNAPVQTQVETPAALHPNPPLCLTMLTSLRLLPSQAKVTGISMGANRLTMSSMDSSTESSNPGGSEKISRVWVSQAKRGTAPWFLM